MFGYTSYLMNVITTKLKVKKMHGLNLALSFKCKISDPLFFKNIVGSDLKRNLETNRL